MPDDKADRSADDDEDEYASQADADAVERKSGGKLDRRGGDERAEAAERGSGKAED